MAIKTEKLPDTLVEKIKTLQKKGNDEIIKLGQIDVDINIFEKEIQRLQKLKIDSLETYTRVVDDINNELKFLESKYPNGEINLDDGTITFSGE